MSASRTFFSFLGILGFVFGLTFFSGTPAHARESRTANYCEIFVDRILAVNGPRDGRTLYIYVKVMSERLEAHVEEVGFLARINRTGEFAPIMFNRYRGAQNYYELALPIYNDGLHWTYEGAFFLRTAHDNLYWLNPQKIPENNFFLDDLMFDHVLAAMGRARNSTPDINLAAPTQTRQLSYFNPDLCY